MGNEAVNRFLEMMSAERGASANTLEAYGRDVEEFLPGVEGNQPR